MNIVQGSLPPAAPPYVLSTPAFRFRALASLAGRAPLGGPREVALATYLIARLVDDCLPHKALPVAARCERSNAARSWLASIALPATVRAPLTTLIEATAREVGEVASALTSAIPAAASYLDTPSQAELERLARAFER